MDANCQNVLCDALRAREKQTESRAELLFVYGGMTPFEVEWLLSSAHPATRIFWIVPEMLALSDVLSSAIDQGRLAVVAVDNAVDVRFFEFFDPKVRLDFVLLDAERDSPEHQQRCEQVLLNLREQVKLCVFNAGTMVTKGPLWQSNTLQNLPLILQSPGTGALNGGFTNRPAVVVAAGPSLTRAMPFLKRVRDRYVVIATGTALAPLRLAGIRPDLVVAVDGSYLIGRQFDCDCNDLYLVSSTLVYPGITPRFRGNYFGLLDLSPIDSWVGSLSEDCGKLYAGGTVTASAMALAADMGCNPVLTLGLDLSFESSGPSHADGSMYDSKPLRDNMIFVPGNYAERVETTRQFSCYIELVHRFVEGCPATRFVNVNDVGSRIDGMELTGFSALLEECGACFDAYAMVEERHRIPPREVLLSACEHLDQVSVYLEKIQSGCREAATALNRLQLMERNPAFLDRDEFKRWLGVLREVDELIESGTRGECRFLQMSLWPSAYELRADLGGGAEVSGSSRMRRFYEQIAGAAKWTRQLLLRARRIVEEIPETESAITCMTGE